MPFNYAAMRLRADRMIARYGMPSDTQTAKLRRKNVGDRPCAAAEIAYTPQERRKLTNPTDRRYLISAEGLDPPPNQQLDSLVICDADGADIEVLRIVEPPGRLAPAGLVVFWDIAARG